MRVLALTNYYPPHHFGGYELSCFDVMTRFEQRGHEVAVLCGAQRLATATEPTAHEEVVGRSLRLYHDGEDLLAPGWRERLAIERHNQERLAEALDRFRPDVVSVWHLAALSSGLLTTIAERRIPVAYAVCEEWPAYLLTLDPWARPFALPTDAAPGTAAAGRTGPRPAAADGHRRRPGHGPPRR